MRSAAWRVSLWGTLAFSFGTFLVFVFLHRFVAENIQRRTDAWLAGEIEVLGDVAEKTPKSAIHDRIVEEVAELASKEIPNQLRPGEEYNDMVFFLETSGDGSLSSWVGTGDGEAILRAIKAAKIPPLKQSDVHIAGFTAPFRVAATRLYDGNLIYLGLSERDELLLLRSLRLRFFFLWLLIVSLGFATVFLSTYRMLGHVRRITDAAKRIGESDLDTRVPASGRNDEIGNLALTLNHMLDRIESSIRQLHAITDSLAHDLRSPLTAIRGKLELSLATAREDELIEPLVAAIEELDRLTEFLTKSLDVAEARAGALRLTRTEIDLDQLMRAMIDLYEPGMSEKGLQVNFHSEGPVPLVADASLIHRMISNLFDNELKHLPAAHSVTFAVKSEDNAASLLVEDDGPGFPDEVGSRVFEHRVKGNKSKGHGLGLTFIEAVARAHGGSASAANRGGGGARIYIKIPQDGFADQGIAVPIGKGA